MQDKVKLLMEKGVVIDNPALVTVADNVDIDKIASGVKICGNCRLEGSRLSIAEGTVLGKEGGVTVVNCQIGKNVNLRGGYFEGAVFLDNVTIGLGAHIRSGTLLEEFASCAHTVGLKQTILMPYVTLGSLINFCDCLMAGGTDKNNHGEVGSSYVHFNYTPHQDKATASLLGDVPRGVMLEQPPVFLGGQGGLVGPSVLAFGTVIAAGTVFRGNVDKPGQLVLGKVAGNAGESRDYNPKIYGNIKRVVSNNFKYIGNLFALREWYKKVRMQFACDKYLQACYDGALFCIEFVIKERIKQFDKFAGNLQLGINEAKNAGMDMDAERFAYQRLFCEHWDEIKEWLENDPLSDADNGNEFLRLMPDVCNDDSYIDTVKAWNKEVKEAGTKWLCGIVDYIEKESMLFLNKEI